MFGIYHLSFVKFFTTGILGILFCYVVYRTKSILLTSLMHFLNNAVSVAAIFYPERMQRLLPVLFQESLDVGEALVLVIAGTVCMAGGLFLCTRTSKERMSAG